VFGSVVYLSIQNGHHAESNTYSFDAFMSATQHVLHINTCPPDQAKTNSLGMENPVWKAVMNALLYNDQVDKFYSDLLRVCRRSAVKQSSTFFSQSPL